MKHRSNDPFNPDVGKKKSFFRKENNVKIFWISIIIIVFLYGSREYFYNNMTKIEIRNINYVEIDYVLVNNESESHYYIINKSPYKIRLIIDDNIITNYDEFALIPEIYYYIWFKSIDYNGRIKLNGVRI